MFGCIEIGNLACISKLHQKAPTITSIMKNPIAVIRNKECSINGLIVNKGQG